VNFQIGYLNRLEDDLRTAAGRASASASPLRPALAPRALIVAAVVVLMSGSLALAFGGGVFAVLDDKPAPNHVKSEFQRMVQPPLPLDGAPPVPKDYLPGKIVRGSQRRVLAIRTSRGKIASLYVSRTTRGQVCFVSVGGPFGSGGCGSSAAREGPFSSLTIGVLHSRRGDKVLVGQGLTVIGRAASPSATLVRIAYADGPHDDVSLVEGWFMFEVPASHTSLASAPSRIDVIAADGTRIGSLKDPFRLHTPRPHFTSPLPATVKLLAGAQLPNDGGIVKIWSGRDARGHNCFRHLRNGRSQRFPVWDCAAMVGHYGYSLNPATGKLSRAHAAVQWEMGLANDPKRPVGFGYAYAYGWVRARVARLTIRFQDGGATDIPLVDRYYLYVVPPAHWPAGSRPSILEARNAQGRLVYRHFLYPRQHCIYPGRDPACRNLAMGTG
jgi:hypothetical protein